MIIYRIHKSIGVNCKRCLVNLSQFPYIVIFIYNIEAWCNGNTADFGSVILGSNPGASTKFAQRQVTYVILPRPSVESIKDYHGNINTPAIVPIS